MIIGLFIAACGCNSPKPPAAPTGSGATSPNAGTTSENRTATATPAGPLVAVAGTQVLMPPPGGFEPAENFPRFADPASGATIMVTELSAPYEATVAGFTAETLGARGMNLLEKQEVDYDGQRGLLVKIEQDANAVTIAKWIAVWGSNQETVLITASYPKLVEDRVGARMKEAVLRAKLNANGPSDPAAGMGFSLDAPDGLKLVQRVGNMLLYARDGAAATARAPGDPLFVAGRAVSNVVVGDLKQFAERRLLETAEVRDIAVTRSEPITIGGLQGHEIEAKANDISSCWRRSGGSIPG